MPNAYVFGHATLGLIEMEAGRFEAAKQSFLTALNAALRIRDRRMEGVTRGYLGELYLKTRKLDEARQALEQALALNRELGARRFEGDALANLGLLHRETGEVVKAEQLLLQAVNMHHECLAQGPEASSSNKLGLVYLFTGRADLAKPRFAHAAELVDRIGELRNAPEITCHVGLCDWVLSKGTVGTEVWQRGLGQVRRRRSAASLAQLIEVMRTVCANAVVPPLPAAPDEPCE